jgi:hypothetical protein
MSTRHGVSVAQAVTEATWAMGDEKPAGVMEAP